MPCQGAVAFIGIAVKADVLKQEVLERCEQRCTQHVASEHRGERPLQAAVSAGDATGCRYRAAVRNDDNKRGKGLDPCGCQGCTRAGHWQCGLIMVDMVEYDLDGKGSAGGVRHTCLHDEKGSDPLHADKSSSRRIGRSRQRN